MGKVVVAKSTITAGQMKDFWRKVGDGTIDFNNFSAFLENPHRLAGDPPVITGPAKTETSRPWGEVWRTVQLGTHQEFHRALTSEGFIISRSADEMLPKVEVALKPSKLQLVVVSVAELGFPTGAEDSQIFVKAVEAGLKRCPAEVGPQLRLQYPDQPRGEDLLIAMRPIADSRGIRGVFCVGHDAGGRWLGTSPEEPHSLWCNDTRWVFVRK